jgi:poly(3-hydroxybutyrate) depolymerase
MNVRAADLADGDCARGRQMYDLGETTIFASRAEPRFSYALYVPPKFGEGPHPAELVVAMHGTGRSSASTRCSPSPTPPVSIRR